MSNFNLILETLETTNRVASIIQKKPVLKFNWGSKSEREIISQWLKSLLKLAVKKPSNPPQMEPLLFSLVDKITLDNRGSILLFLSDMKKYLSHPNLIPLVTKNKEDVGKILDIILEELEEWQEISEKYFIESRKNLELVIKKSSSHVFYCMIKELHPRKLIEKHSWNEVQIRSIEPLSTEEIIKTIEKDTISGNRFFLQGDKAGLGTGIRILNGHHRLYVLYKKYINWQVNGETIIPFLEEH